MKFKKIILALLLSSLFYLVFSYLTGTLRLPGLSIYKTYPNVLGGCFNICDGNENIISCRGDPKDPEDSFATCTYYCIGKVSNTCN